MLPATNTSYPFFFNIWPKSKVVVVFPLVPVIATILAFVNLNANSTSEIIGIFFAQYIL